MGSWRRETRKAGAGAELALANPSTTPGVAGAGQGDQGGLLAPPLLVAAAALLQSEREGGQ